MVHDEEILDGLREALAKITSLSKKKKGEWQSMENFNYEMCGPDQKVSGLRKKARRHDKISGQGPSSSTLSMNHVLPSSLPESKVERSINEDQMKSIMDLSRSVDVMYHFMRNNEGTLEDL